MALISIAAANNEEGSRPTRAAPFHLLFSAPIIIALAHEPGLGHHQAPLGGVDRTTVLAPHALKNAALSGD